MVTCQRTPRREQQSVTVYNGTEFRENGREIFRPPVMCEFQGHSGPVQNAVHQTLRLSVRKPGLRHNRFDHCDLVALRPEPEDLHPCAHGANRMNENRAVDK